MSGNIGANQYKQMAIKTATPGQILIMLYEAAIQNTKKAMDCIDKKDLPGKGKFIGKTHDILNELTVSLNHEIGGEIAGNLERLYNFMIEQLIKANIENSKGPLEAVKTNLETLLAAWRVAVTQAQKGTK
jgi:flagellar protein FliS